MVCLNITKVSTIVNVSESVEEVTAAAAPTSTLVTVFEKSIQCNVCLQVVGQINVRAILESHWKCTVQWVSTRSAGRQSDSV